MTNAMGRDKCPYHSESEAQNRRKRKNGIFASSTRLRLDGSSNERAWAMVGQLGGQ
jgi:hypothetical protein